MNKQINKYASLNLYIKEGHAVNTCNIHRVYAKSMHYRVYDRGFRTAGCCAAYNLLHDNTS
jgi:hypothetical protein